jgi:hypothetical protein
MRKAPIGWHLSIEPLKMMLVALSAWFCDVQRIHAGRLVTTSLGLKGGEIMPPGKRCSNLTLVGIALYILVT